MKHSFLTYCEDLFLNRNDIDTLIDKWIFSERDRAILKRKLLDDISFQDIAEEYDYSIQGIKNIVYKCEMKLLSALDKQFKNSKKKKNKK